MRLFKPYHSTIYSLVSSLGSDPLYRMCHEKRDRTVITWGQANYGSEHDFHNLQCGRPCIACTIMEFIRLIPIPLEERNLRFKDIVSPIWVWGFYVILPRFEAVCLTLTFRLASHSFFYWVFRRKQVHPEAIVLSFPLLILILTLTAGLWICQDYETASSPLVRQSPIVFFYISVNTPGLSSPCCNKFRGQ
jgi:hypothetical protein